MAETEHEPQNGLIYHTEGPIYQDGVWVAHMTLKEQKSETIQGQTKEEVQEQMLHFLGQQALEIEKARILLRKSFESKPEK